VGEEPNHTTHRVDSVLGFFSSRPNWDPPPTPSPAGECVPHPFGSGGPGGEGDTLACCRGGGDGPNSDEGTDTVVLYVYSMYLVKRPYESLGLNKSFNTL
jgi:hypothetical protein